MINSVPLVALLIHLGFLFLLDLILESYTSAKFPTVSLTVLSCLLYLGPGTLHFVCLCL